MEQWYDQLTSNLLIDFLGRLCALGLARGCRVLFWLKGLAANCLWNPLQMVEFKDLSSTQSCMSRRAPLHRIFCLTRSLCRFCVEPTFVHWCNALQQFPQEQWVTWRILVIRFSKWLTWSLFVGSLIKPSFTWSWWSQVPAFAGWLHMSMNSLTLVL